MEPNQGLGGQPQVAQTIPTAQTPQGTENLSQDAKIFTYKQSE